MSLSTDRFFWNALKADSAIETKTGGRIFNPARDIESEAEDLIPYIIITLDGGSNSQESKDDLGESDTDQVTVSILIVEKDRESLAELSELVRSTIKNAMIEGDDSLSFSITDYSISYSAVQMDIDKPCVYQTLTYNCETTQN